MVKAGHFVVIAITEDASCCKALVREFGMLILSLEGKYLVLLSDVVGEKDDSFLLIMYSFFAIVVWCADIGVWCCHDYGSIDCKNERFSSIETNFSSESNIEITMKFF